MRYDPDHLFIALFFGDHHLFGQFLYEKEGVWISLIHE